MGAEVRAFPAQVARPSLWGRFSLKAISEFTVPICVLGIVMALIVPVPPFLLDLLIVVNITLSVVVMMVAMYVERPVEFSVFPTTLLLLTLFRLALNVSSSRLILMNGNSGTQAAGHVIEAFGVFVVGGNYVIGAVIFLVLIAIQYVVINHGAVRISEVTARFTLDALPGKQMSIDADLNAGLIDEKQARSRRKDLSLEAEFYGAMDGASRFTQRDAIASILITVINIAAGFLIGVFQHHMDLVRALQTYTVLTIGDGLVTVIPALMISVSGGIVITRAGSETRVGVDFQRQLFSNTNPLLLASGVLGVLAMLPGLPTLPFLTLGSGLAAIAWNVRKKNVAAAAASTEKAKKKGASDSDNLEALLRTEPVAVELGLGLVHLVDGGADSPLLKRIAGIRKQLAELYGYLLPPVKVNDNLSLRSREYVILIRGVPVSRYELLQGHELAISDGHPDPSIPGVATKEPAYGMEAIWVPEDAVEQALQAGYTVVDDVGTVGTHLLETVRSRAHEIFSREDAKAFCDRVGRQSPKAVEDLVPKLLPLAGVQKVLQSLLREEVSIRDGVYIMEALSEGAAISKNPVLLTEYVRQAIRRSLIGPHLNNKNELAAYFTGPKIDRAIEEAVEHSEQNSILTLAPQKVREVIGAFQQRLGTPQASGVVVTSSGSRYFLRQILETPLPNLAVMSHNEIPPNINVRSLGVIE